MKTILLKFLLALACALSFVITGRGEESAAKEAAASAQKFLATLDDANRAKVVFDYKDEAQRKRWSNLPTTFVKRGGLRMGDLTPPQREAALAVVAAALSPQGYTKAMQIVQADEELHKSDARGMFGQDNYYISFLGQPSATDPWMIQFGGHHLGINITLAGEQNTVAPSHTGAQPAHFEVEGKLIRPLGGESDKAYALLLTLDDAQRKKAILGSQTHDMVLGPGRDGQTIQPEGIKGSDLTDAQRDALLDLAGEWTSMMREPAAKAKMEEMRKNLAETWFAWSGPTEKGAAAYFRIQGPTVFIEYAPQKLGGDLTNHIHTIYRDPSNDYGVKWSKP